MNSDNDPNGVSVGDSSADALDDYTELHKGPSERALLALAREVLKRLSDQFKHHKMSPGELEALADALISSDARLAAQLVEDRAKSGVPFSEIYLEYLAPAAALLGRRWEADEVTFADVTVGTGRVYAIMRSINSRARPDRLPENHSAIFAMVPGDDHVLGLKMATDLARKRGWDIEPFLDADHDTLVNAVTESGTLLVGLSGGTVESLPSLARLVLALRIHAPRAKILVSGNIANVAKENIELLHVDAICTQFDDAMAQLEGLWNSFRDPDHN